MPLTSLKLKWAYLLSYTLEILGKFISFMAKFHRKKMEKMGVS